MRSNADRDMMMPSHCPVAHRATNSRRRPPCMSSRCATRTLAWGYSWSHSRANWSIMWFGTMMAGLVTRPRRRSSVTPMIISAVFPHPVGELAGQLSGLLLRGEGGVQVDHGPLPVGGADDVADFDLALLADGLGELRRGVAGGAPGRG